MDAAEAMQGIDGGLGQEGPVVQQQGHDSYRNYYWEDFFFNRPGAEASIESENGVQKGLYINYATAEGEYGSALDNYFLKSVTWAPDGSCLLSNSEDNLLRVLELSTPEAMMEGVNSGVLPLRPVLKVKPGDAVYDTSWYPHMTSQDPSTCAFLTTSRAHPVHMWDAFSGVSRCTYRAYDHADEIVAALSVSFNLSGNKIYCGYNNSLRIFDTAKPGRDCTIMSLSPKDSEHKGLMSCIGFNPDGSGIYAIGSYSRTIGIYSEAEGSQVGVISGPVGGITRVQWSQDGRYLFTGGRKDHELLCWDIRNTGEILFRFERIVNNNQHIGFHVHPSGRYLITGCQSGAVLAYDLTAEGRLLYKTAQNFGVVNDVGFHPSAPCIAISTGERKLALQCDDSDEEEEEKEKEKEKEEDTPMTEPATLPNGVYLLTVPPIPSSTQNS